MVIHKQTALSSGVECGVSCAERASQGRHFDADGCNHQSKGRLR
jgi:hypothetical protein